MNTIWPYRMQYVARLTGKLQPPVERGHTLGVTATHVSTLFQNELQTLLHVDTVLLCLVSELWRQEKEEEEL